MFAAETGLRPEEWIALERRDVDRDGRAVRIERAISAGELQRYGKTDRSRRSVPLTARALAALDGLVARLHGPVFAAPEGGYIDLDNWRSRSWAAALTAAGFYTCERCETTMQPVKGQRGGRRCETCAAETTTRGPYHLRHVFASEALAAGVQTFELSRVMGCSVEMIDKTYGHLVRGAHDAIRERLDARAAANASSVRHGG